MSQKRPASPSPDDEPRKRPALDNIQLPYDPVADLRAFNYYEFKLKLAKTDAEREVLLNKRWGYISGSANLDDRYKEDTLDPKTAYRFVCICDLPFDVEEAVVSKESDQRRDQDQGQGGQDQRDPESQGNTEPPEAADADKPASTESAESNETPKPKCDNGKTCLCWKPADEHPDHPWKISYAGYRKYQDTLDHADLRNPALFHLALPKKHYMVGMLELLQNLILDFAEADCVQEQWAICEALALYLDRVVWFAAPLGRNNPMMDATCKLIGRIILTTLARLDREEFLEEPERIPDLGLVMGCFITWAYDVRDHWNVLKWGNPVSFGPTNDSPRYMANNSDWWCPHNWDEYVVAYAEAYDIPLRGPEGLSKARERAFNVWSNIPSDKFNMDDDDDPFGFAAALQRYKENYKFVTSQFAGIQNTKIPIGGDNLDVTSWPRGMRAKHHHDAEGMPDNRDPLSTERIKALRDGEVLALSELGEAEQFF